MNIFLRIAIVVLISFASLPGFSHSGAAARQDTADQQYEMRQSGAYVRTLDTEKAKFRYNTYTHQESSNGISQEWIRMDVGTSTVSIYILDQASTDGWHAGSIRALSDQFWRGGEILFQEETATTSTILARGSHMLEYDQVLYIEFHLNVDVDLDIAVSILGSPDALQDDLQIAYETISINWQPVFPTHREKNLESYLDGTAGVEPVTIEPHDFSPESWSHMKIVSDSRWDYGSTGTFVTWDGEHWIFPFHNVNATYHSYPKDARFFHLVHSGYLAESIHYFDDYRPEFDPERAERDLVSEGFLKTSVQEGRHLTLLSSTHTDSVAMAIYEGTYKYGEPIVQISTTHVIPLPDGDGVRVQTSFTSTREHIGEMWTSYLENVHIEGYVLDGLWSAEEIQAILENPTSATPDPTAETIAVAQAGDSMVAPVSGVTIDLGPSGEATFVSDQPFLTEYSQYTRENVSLERGTTVVVIDLMEGDVDIDDYMLLAESEIAATFDYMDWLGGKWSAAHSWDVYSGAYKLDYRELAYLELVQDPESGLFYGIGVYGSESDVTSGLEWLQNNVTIDGQGILAMADIGQIGSVIDGSSGFIAEPVPMYESTVSDWNNAGLVSETEWQSPFTNTSFTWDGDSLIFPFAQQDALSANDGVTTLELRTSDRRGEIKLSTAEVPHSPADWVANYTSDEYQESQAAIGQPITILDSRVTGETGSVILLFHTDYGDPVVTIMDVYVNEDGVTILTEISAAPEDIADVYAAFWDSVQSNGDYYPLTWDVEEIGAFETVSQNPERKA